MEEEGGDNLYTSCENCLPCTFDALGEWGESVHYLGTMGWAASYFPMKAAKRVAQADIAVDGWGPGIGPISPAPIVGDQTYHFDRPWGGPDSRLEHTAEHLMAAKRLCLNLVADKPKEAAKELGTALHPLQDYYAHGDFGYTEVRLSNVWVMHNKHAPKSSLPAGYSDPVALVDDYEYDVVGSPDGRPVVAAVGDVGTTGWPRRNYEWFYFQRGSSRHYATEQASRRLLAEYRSHLIEWAQACCKCKKYFDY